MAVNRRVLRYSNLRYSAILISSIRVEQQNRKPCYLPALDDQKLGRIQAEKYVNVHNQPVMIFKIIEERCARFARLYEPYLWLQSILLLQLPPLHLYQHLGQKDSGP